MEKIFSEEMKYIHISKNEYKHNYGIVIVKTEKKLK